MQTDAKRLIRELNDLVFLSPHEGRTAEFFRGRHVSRRARLRVMNESIKLLLAATE